MSPAVEVREKLLQTLLLIRFENSVLVVKLLAPCKVIVLEEVTAALMVRIPAPLESLSALSVTDEFVLKLLSTVRLPEALALRVLKLTEEVSHVEVVRSPAVCRLTIPVVDASKVRAFRPDLDSVPVLFES